MRAFKYITLEFILLIILNLLVLNNEFIYTYFCLELDNNEYIIHIVLDKLLYCLGIYFSFIYVSRVPEVCLKNYFDNLTYGMKPTKQGFEYVMILTY